MRIHTWIKRVGWCVILAGLAICTSQAVADDGQAFAGDGQTAAQSPDLASLQKRLQMLEDRFNGPADGSCCCEGVCCDPCCHTPGLTFLAETAFLRFCHNQFGALGYNDLEAAPRLSVGWTGPGGLGARVRWFQYEDSDAASLVDRVRFYTLDAEITDTFTLGCKWSGILAGGIRYAEYFEDWNIDDVSWDHHCGVGPVVSLELDRCVTDRFSLFMLARGSLLFGDYQVQSIEGGGGNGFGQLPSVSRGVNGCYTISELQLGGQWQRPLKGTAYFFIRGAVEAQCWQDVSSGFVGLVGGNVAMGLYR